MSEISIIMPTYNAEKYLKEAIESVLKQTFIDFEFIIIDDGSTDNTMQILRSFTDQRIKLIENKHDFVGSLNKGLSYASGKYIARMDADDIMHIDRLKIQYTIMEDEPSITLSSTWMIPFGENVPRGVISQSSFGLLDSPLLHLLKGNAIFHPTVMIKHEFLKKHNLCYEKYDYAEDYKLWLEIAKRKGVFYVESQPLMLYRVSEQQVSKQKRNSQIKTSIKVRNEILDYLLKINERELTRCMEILELMRQLRKIGLITDDDIFGFFYMLLDKNRNSLNLV